MQTLKKSYVHIACVWTKMMDNINTPNPIAAQHNTVTIDRVTLRLVIEWAGRGFRSQQRVSKYSNNPKSETINNAAGNDPQIPKL